MIRIPGVIPLTIHPIFFVVAGMIGFLSTHEIAGALIWMGIIFVSVLFHEYGHALTALFFGQSPEIHLVGFGGLTTHEAKGVTLWRQFLIVLNGPIFGLLLGLGAYQFYSMLPSQKTALGEALYVTYVINIFWTVVNLLPVQPLDGGHLLRIILEGMFGYRGVRISIMMSMLIGISISAFFFALGLLIPGILFVILTFESWRSWSSTRNMTAIDRMGEWQGEIDQAEQEYKAGHFDEALERCGKIRDATKSGLIHQAASVLSARIHFGQGDVDEAYELLYPIRVNLTDAERLLLFQAAHESEKWEVILELGDEIYRLSPTSEVALTNAEAHAQAGNDQPAVGWLQCAERDGAPNVNTYIEHPTFDPIRRSHLFQEWLQSKE